MAATLAAKPAGRRLALARRTAQSGRGKLATTPNSAASLARQVDPRLSGRELAQRVREQRSNAGGAGERKSQPCGRVRPKALVGAADQPWKVGASETSQGQTVTGTRVGRSRKTTGDEPSTCRVVTGTEYMGAEIFREFCQAEPPRGVPKVRVSPTGGGNRVTGNEVGRSGKVTGDEPGTCQRITGNDYLSPSQYEAYCNTRPEPNPRQTGRAATRAGQTVTGNLPGRSPKVTGDEHGAGIRPTGTQYTDVESITNRPLRRAPSALAGPSLAELAPVASPQVPPKVGRSATLSGGAVTGTLIGRSLKVTGDEPGSCRAVTGDEYIAQEQYQFFCEQLPSPEPPKVGHSATLKRQIVSGTQTGRSTKVTGDEPGTCTAVTGTPYAGLEQADAYCKPVQTREIRARARPLATTPGANLSGIQPGIGEPVTGTDRGTCATPTGTPYVGEAQFAAACAAPGEADFPQPLGGEEAPWQAGFSVRSPAREAFQAAQRRSAVTGTRYETGGRITGPFDMASGKITGTEQFRFDGRRPLSSRNVLPAAGAAISENDALSEDAAMARARITGEGQSTGLKITGDDWDRGERVTGTEGAWAKQRNPSRPGPMSAMPTVERKRNEDKPLPVSRVTGSSGSTDRGSLVTYSGGARG